VVDTHSEDFRELFQTKRIEGGDNVRKLISNAVLIAILATMLVVVPAGAMIINDGGGGSSTIGPVQPYTIKVPHSCAITPGIAWSTHTVYLRYWQDPTHNLVVDTTIKLTAGPTCYQASARTQVGYQIKYRVWGFLWYTTGWKTFVDNNPGAAFGRTVTWPKTGYGEAWWNIRVLSNLRATDALTMAEGQTPDAITYWPNPPLPGNEVLQ